VITGPTYAFTTVVDVRSNSGARRSTSCDSETFDTINQLQKNLAFNLSGHVLHSLFWRETSLAPSLMAGSYRGSL